MPQRFFIVGCQRSGTTLLRLILECHAHVFCYDEMHAYDVLMKGEEQHSGPESLIGFKIPRWTEQLLQDTLWDEGLPGSCPSFYHGEKLLFLIRDPRDSVASMYKLGSVGARWVEMWPARILLRKILRDGSFRAMYAEDLARVGQSECFLAATAAFYWIYKNSAFLQYRKAGLPVHGVRYEELVTNPEPVLRGVCEFLQIDWDDALLEHNKREHTELFVNGLTVGNTDPKQAISTGSIHQAVQFLSSHELRTVDEITNKLNLLLDAEIPRARSTFQARDATFQP